MMLRSWAGRLLLATAVAVGTAGCAVAYKTGLMGKDVLTDAQQVVADIHFHSIQLNPEGLKLQASVDREDRTYDPGQPITLSVTVDKDAFVAILRVLPNGDTTIIFPNRAHPIAFVSANTTLKVPSPDDNVKLTADKPGVVLFQIVASTTGRSWLFSRKPTEGADFADLGVSSREIAKDITTNLNGGEYHAVGATHLAVRVSGGGLL